MARQTCVFQCCLSDSLSCNFHLFELNTKAALYYGFRDTLSLMINEYIVFYTALKHAMYSIVKQCKCMSMFGNEY
jgi:hypothetical protein